MVHDDLLLALQLLMIRMRRTKRLQYFVGILTVYVVLKIFFQTSPTLFTVSFTRNRASLVAFLTAIIMVALNKIHRNYRISGQQLITMLGPLNQQEAAIVQQFKRC
ncbi:hypothetical protein [Loigolactobacillus iwatensis]|uniref:hypothetical protein n=1 Tax=Loigolactobacillus iwatensis TaxID=1267156 RepID=UPI000F7FA4F7|nr:hypothetical protein [Loigolactobacillus iwatensis]